GRHCKLVEAGHRQHRYAGHAEAGGERHASDQREQEEADEDGADHWAALASPRASPPGGGERRRSRVITRRSTSATASTGIHTVYHHCGTPSAGEVSSKRYWSQVSLPA